MRKKHPDTPVIPMDHATKAKFMKQINRTAFFNILMRFHSQYKLSGCMDMVRNLEPVLQNEAMEFAKQMLDPTCVEINPDEASVVEDCTGDVKIQDDHQEAPSVSKLDSAIKNVSTVMTAFGWVRGKRDGLKGYRLTQSVRGGVWQAKKSKRNCHLCYSRSPRSRANATSNLRLQPGQILYRRRVQLGAI